MLHCYTHKISALIFNKIRKTFVVKHYCKFGNNAINTDLTFCIRQITENGIQ